VATGGRSTARQGQTGNAHQIRAAAISPTLCPFTENSSSADLLLSPGPQSRGFSLGKGGSRKPTNPPVSNANRPNRTPRGQEGGVPWTLTVRVRRSNNYQNRKFLRASLLRLTLLRGLSALLVLFCRRICSLCFEHAALATAARIVVTSDATARIVRADYDIPSARISVVMIPFPGVGSCWRKTCVRDWNLGQGEFDYRTQSSKRGRPRQIVASPSAFRAPQNVDDHSRGPLATASRLDATG
jgi:hypothetical protein